MPEVLEQDPIALELARQAEEARLAEEERLRLEEEARLLAQQQALAQQAFVSPGIAQGNLPPMPEAMAVADPANFISQPDAEAAALQAQFNQQAQPTAYVPAVRESYTPDSAQYQAEVARAQRGSGFINADIGPGGNLITPGYDPELDPRALVARREAENLQRNQYVNSLVQGGATYAEALRAGLGRYPQTGNDAMRLKVEQLAQKQNQAVMQPEIVTINGVRALRTGPRSFSRIPEPSMVKGELTAAARAQSGDIGQEITGLRTELRTGTKALSVPGLLPGETKTKHVSLTGSERAAKEQHIQTLQEQRQQLLERPEFNPRIDQTGFDRARWDNPPPVVRLGQPTVEVAAAAPLPVAPVATPAQAKAVNELRRLTKDGKVAVYDAQTKKFLRFE